VGTLAKTKPHTSNPEPKTLHDRNLEPRPLTTNPNPNAPNYRPQGIPPKPQMRYAEGDWCRVEASAVGQIQLACQPIQLSSVAI